MIPRIFADNREKGTSGRPLVIAILAIALVPLLAACSDFNQDGSPNETRVQTLASTSTMSTPISTPTPIAGTLRMNPVPYGYPLSHKAMEIAVSDTFNWNSGELLFESVKREGNITTETRLHAPDAGEGFVWLVIEIQLRNIGNPNQTRIIKSTHFKVAGGSGATYELADVPPKKQRKWYSFAERWERHLGKRYLDSGEFFGGSELTGHLIARVAKEEDDLVLIYSPGSQDSSYLSLKKSTASGTLGRTPSAAPTQRWPLPPLGTGRTNPVLYGTAFAHNGMELTILEVGRLAQEGTFFPGLSLRKAPREGCYYVAIKLRLRNVGDPNESRVYSEDHFWVTGKLGFVYSEVFSPDSGELQLGRGEFFGGGEITGAMVVEIPSDDDQLVLIYSPPFSAGTSYYSLEQPQR